MQRLMLLSQISWLCPPLLIQNNRIVFPAFLKIFFKRNGSPKLFASEPPLCLGSVDGTPLKLCNCYSAHPEGGCQQQWEVQVSMIGWVVLGLISRFIASKIVNRQGEGLILDIVLGIVGAIVGGYLFTLFGAQGVSGANIYSMFVAVIGAIVVLVIYHSVTGRRTV